MGGQHIWSLLLALVGVFLVIYISYIFSRYMAKGMNKLGSAKYIRVVDRMVLGQEKSLAIMEIGAKYYLISMTSQNISLIKELSQDDLLELKTDENSGKSFNAKTFLDFKELFRENIKEKPKKQENQKLNEEKEYE